MCPNGSRTGFGFGFEFDWDLEVYAGAGVEEGSDPSEEFEEISSLGDKLDSRCVRTRSVQLDASLGTDVYTVQALTPCFLEE